jgi:type I restriction-modification system DNA methylase subunit
LKEKNMPLTEDQARQKLQNLLTDYHNLSGYDRKEMTEASVVRQFIDRLLEEVLGWPIKDPARYKYELSTQTGRPDITFIPEKGGTIFVEAKRFGIIKQLEQARFTTSGTITPGQMALPGMAVDRTPEEQQAINYAFSNNGTWAILTNFEKLRLFNARRDWLVLSFEEPSAYLHEFDLLWQLSYENVLNGSLDVLSNQRLRENVDNDYLAFINEWRERLAQDIVERQAENHWAFQADGNINLTQLRAVVQRFLDRLVVIRFAEDHLVIPSGTLRQFYELRRSNIYAPSMNEFLDRFFRQFDEKHNSALFAKDLTDDASFSEDALMPLIAKLYEARYRSMPADIIGNTYEQYLGKTLVLSNGSITTKDNLETRKKQGSYYTPQVIVRYIVDHSLGRYLYGTENGQPDGKPVSGETHKTSADIGDLRILDSACGSGSFLIYAYYVLAEFYESEMKRIEATRRTHYEELVKEGIDPFTIEIRLTDYKRELERIDNYPRLILETHLYGTDLDPQAAEIAVVNLMMRAMERRHHQKRLPLILNQNVKVGNALIGLRPDDEKVTVHREKLAKIYHLRLKQVNTPNGSKHDQIIQDLGEAIKELNTALDDNFADHFSDLTRVRPFHWGVEFPEVFYDENGQLKDNPGFTIIIGNPPYGGEITGEQTAYYQSRYDTASAADSFALFMERSTNLLTESGSLGMIVPSGWVSMTTMLPLRQFFVDSLKPGSFVSLPYDMFDAYVDTIIFTAQRLQSGTTLKDLDSADTSLVVFPIRHTIETSEEFEKFKKQGNAIRWLNNEDMEFLITLSDGEISIIDKLTQIGGVFSNVSDIQRGVTPFHKSPEKPLTNPSLAFDGTVRRYRLFQGEEVYIRYDKTLAEYKPPKYFKGPRILLRELISRQFQLQAALVEQDFVTNKSMQSIILTNANYDIHYLLGLLNSKLLSWYFLAVNSVARRDDFPKIVLRQSRNLPFRTIDFSDPAAKQQHDDLVELVKQILELNQQLISGNAADQETDLQNKIDDLDQQIDVAVYKLFGLTDAQVSLIENTER